MKNSSVNVNGPHHFVKLYKFSIRWHCIPHQMSHINKNSKLCCTNHWSSWTNSNADLTELCFSLKIVLLELRPIQKWTKRKNCHEGFVTAVKWPLSLLPSSSFPSEQWQNCQLNVIKIHTHAGTHHHFSGVGWSIIPHLPIYYMSNSFF